MRGTVVWLPAAQGDLATLWTNAPDRADVTAAANAIVDTLRRDPYALSESRSGPTRILFVRPLAIAFDVSDADCLVTVWAIWRPH